MRKLVDKQRLMELAAICNPYNNPFKELNEIGGHSTGSPKADELAQAIDAAMMPIDDSMSYKDFALAVGKVLIDQYGQHNYQGFMEVLHKELGM